MEALESIVAWVFYRVLHLTKYGVYFFWIRFWSGYRARTLLTDWWKSSYHRLQQIGRLKPAHFWRPTCVSVHGSGRWGIPGMGNFLLSTNTDDLQLASFVTIFMREPQQGFSCCNTHAWLITQITHLDSIRLVRFGFIRLGCVRCGWIM